MAEYFVELHPGDDVPWTGACDVNSTVHGTKVSVSFGVTQFSVHATSFYHVFHVRTHSSCSADVTLLLAVVTIIHVEHGRPQEFI